MRSRCLVLVSVLGSIALPACGGRRLHVGDDVGAGGRGGGSGQAGAAAGAGGTVTPSGTGGASALGAGGSLMPSGTGGAGGSGGTGDPGGTTGTGGAAGQTGGGGAPGMLSVDPSSATFASTLVEAVSAPQRFTVRNVGGAAAGAIAVLAAFEGTNAADFSITANDCGPALQPGASCTIAVAFSPKTRSGSRSARLILNAPPGPAASLTGTASPSLGLLAGVLGAPGYVDGTGAAARFGGPLGVAGDGAGNLYVADGNSTIRKIVIATGAVTTVAGAAGQTGAADGTGTAARFSGPGGIASDGAGNLFVSDTDNHTIRRIAIATGAVTTLAGTPGQTGSANRTGAAARFNSPSGIVSDGAGNLFVADTGNHTIRKVVVATGAVTALAGTAGQTGSTDGTGAAARFYSPSGVASDGAGNLFVADNETGIVRKIVLATGAVTTLAGTFAAAYGVTTDGAGNLFVAASGSVRKVVLATGADTLVAGAVGQFGTGDGTGAAARFGYPLTVAADGTGNVYVGDRTNATVRKVVTATGDVTTLAGAAGAGSADGTGAGARFQLPSGIASDGAGNVYVADLGNNTVRQIVAGTRAVTTLAGTPGSTGWGDGTGPGALFDYPTTLTCDGAGNVYVGETSTGSVRKVVVATRTVTSFRGVAGMPSGIVFDGAGSLYIGDGYWYTINKIDIATGTTSTLTKAIAFTRPAGIAGDGAGNLYVTDSFNRVIKKVVIATGEVTTFAGAAGAGAAADFTSPTGIASDGAGNLYVADGNTIRKVEIVTATVSTVIGVPDRVGVTLGALPASLNDAHGVTVLPTGELAITDGTENSVLMGHL